MKIPKFKAMLQQIQDERGIKADDVVNALEEALMLAAKKRFPDKEDVLSVKMTDEGEAKIFECGKEITPKDFGRLAAQTAKQVIIQRIREAEKEGIFNEYSARVGTLINGTVKRKDNHGYFVDIGRIETYLSLGECIPLENLRPGDRVKMIVLDVKKGIRASSVIVSRSHPDFIKKLFEIEVPEIEDGVLEVMGIAREAGRRTKIAIKSNDPNVGVIGTCVGQMGSRIQNITREIGGERIDIIEWAEDIKKYIAASLSPAKSSKIQINEDEKSVKVFLPNTELSLAIGKEGQNVRLAARLTGYKIDILSAEDKTSEAMPDGRQAKNAKEEK